MDDFESFLLSTQEGRSLLGTEELTMSEIESVIVGGRGMGDQVRTVSFNEVMCGTHGTQ